MSQPDPVPPPPAAIPWYKSNVLRGLLIVVITHTLAHYKLISQFTPTDIGIFVDDGLSVLGYLAAGFSAYARVRDPNPPITTTKAKAEAKNLPIPSPTKDPTQ